MNDYRYRCVGCKKEFTLHSAEPLDPYEFDPACAWCGDLTGLPCVVPPEGATAQERLMANFQVGIMSELARGIKGDCCAGWALTKSVHDPPCRAIRERGD